MQRAGVPRATGTVVPVIVFVRLIVRNQSPDPTPRQAAGPARPST